MYALRFRLARYLLRVISWQMFIEHPFLSSVLCRPLPVAGVWGSLLPLLCTAEGDLLPHPAPPEPGPGMLGIADLELAHLNKVQIAAMWVSSLSACFLGGREWILAKQIIVDCCDMVDVS